MTLWVHAALVAAAIATVVRDPGDAWVWVPVSGIAAIQVSLFTGSRFAWWVEVVAMVAALNGLYEAHQRVRTSGVDLSTFFDPSRSAVTAFLLAAAAVALLLPSARAHASRGPRFQMTARRWVLFAAGVVFAASIPVELLSAAERLPSEGLVEYAEGATFIGGDARQGLAIYAKEDSQQICLVHLERGSGGSSCGDVLSHYPPGIDADGDDFSGIVDKEVVRVWIHAGGGPWFEATVVDDPRFSANFYYLFDGPSHAEHVEVVGFDARGTRTFRETRG